VKRQSVHFVCVLVGMAGGDECHVILEQNQNFGKTYLEGQ